MDVAVAREADVSYTFESQLFIDKYKTDSYNFPITRSKDKLTMIEICHSLLRSTQNTHTIDSYDEKNDHSQTYEPIQTKRHKTLQAILELVNSGKEWKPSNIEYNASSDINMKRKDMVRMINKYAIDISLTNLYDTRFVSEESNFCESTEQDPRVAEQLFHSKPFQFDINQDNNFNIDNERTQKTSVPAFGMSSRKLGDVHKMCPCEQPVKSENTDVCIISSVICELQYESGIINSTTSKFSEVFIECGSLERQLAPTIEYKKIHVRYVRDILFSFGELLKTTGFICHTLLPSDLWGITPSHFNNDQYLAHEKNIKIDLLHSLLHPKSGVYASNYEQVRDNVHTILGEDDRGIRLEDSGEDEFKDTVRNLLCGDKLDERIVAKLGFPAVTKVSESPVVLTCSRYVMEVSWKDILLEFLPLVHVDNNDAPQSAEISNIHIIHAEADSMIEEWKNKCQVKIQKLQTCHSQAAFSPQFIMDSDKNKDIIKKQKKQCPFTLSEQLQTLEVDTTQTALIHTACLVLYDKKMYDPHMCVPLSVKYSENMPYALKISDLVLECSVYNVLNLLSVVKSPGIVDIPELSRDFVLSLISPIGGTEESHVRKSGIIGTKSGIDFLFPSSFNTQGMPDNAGSSQCYDTIPYWPKHWQAPFGETLLESYKEGGIGFSNYMALLIPDKDNCPNGDCEEEIILLPDHLKHAESTMNEFGTGGLCREHSFGMPRIQTNTHKVCTSLNNQGQVDLETFIPEEESSENICSDTSKISLGGGINKNIANLWPWIRIFLQERQYDDTEMDLYDLLPNDQIFTVQNIMQMMPDLSINIDFGDDTVLDYIANSKCYHQDMYAIDAVSCQNTSHKMCCQFNEDCNKGHVCGVLGICEEMDIEIQNKYTRKDVEVGLNSAGCGVSDNFESVSGASPWRRLNDILEQHGLCSHSNTVTHERMNMSFQKNTDSCYTVDDVDPELLHWICKKDQTNWTWVRQNPFFTNMDPGMDTRSDPETHTVKASKLFQIEPHLCDSDYMHSKTLGWCGLQLLNSDVETSSTYAKWMRTADKFSDFSMLVSPSMQEEITRRENFADADYDIWKSDKLRFMGLHREDIKQFDNEVERYQSSVQKCAAYGICQQEIFTYGGIDSRRIKNTRPQELSIKKRSVRDTIQCTSMGYMKIINDVNENEFVASQNDITCILDPFVAIVFYHLHNATYTNCRKIFKKELPTGLLSVGYGTTQHFTYKANEIEEKIGIQSHMNKFLSFHTDVLTLAFTDSSLGNRYTRNDELHSCMVDIISELKSKNIRIHYDNVCHDKQKCADKNLNEENESLGIKTSGLYLFYDFGTHEIPFLWWLKLGLEKKVFSNSNNVDLIVTNSIKLESFDHRFEASKAGVDFIRRDSEDQRANSFWSRINTNELGIHEKAQQSMNRYIASYLKQHQNFSTQPIFGCVKSYTVDNQKHKDIQTARNEAKLDDVAEGTNSFIVENANTIEKFLWYIFHDVSIGGSNTEVERATFTTINKNSYTTKKQFENINILPTQNIALEDIFSFESRDLEIPPDTDDYNSLFGHLVRVIMQDYNNNPIHIYDPIQMPNKNVVWDESGRSGIKIMHFEMDGILEALKAVDWQQSISEFLDAFDKSKQCANPRKIPKFQAKNVDKGACVPQHTHCIFDKRNLKSLKSQGILSNQVSWNDRHDENTQYALLKLHTKNDMNTPFNTINLCKKTTQFTHFGHSMIDESNQRPEDGGYTGGRCTFADLNAYGEGTDNPLSPLSNNEIPVNNDLQGPSECDDNEKCFQTCNKGADYGGSTYSEPFLVKNNNNHVFAGQQYMQQAPIARKKNALCHRIDSGCVTQHKKANINKIFGNRNNRPVDAKYRDIERNAFTQTNIRRQRKQPLSYNSDWGSGARDDPFKFSDQIMKVWSDANGIPIDNIFDKTIPNYLWRNKRKRPDDDGMCGVHKITKHPAFNVNTYVLNSQLDDATFSNVIYNDRILMQREHRDTDSISDSWLTFFGHHYHTLIDGHSEFEQTTTPNPLFSFCPSAGTEIDYENNYGAMHKFKIQNFDYGKRRMVGKQYHFNQEIGMDQDFIPSPSKNTAPVSLSKTFLDAIQPCENSDRVRDWGNFWKVVLGGANVIPIMGKTGKDICEETVKTVNWQVILRYFFYNRFLWTDASPLEEDGDSDWNKKAILEQRMWGDLPVLSDTVLQDPWFSFFMHENKTIQHDRYWQNSTAPHATRHKIPCKDMPPIGKSWTIHDLATCYEMNPYERVNVESLNRPWWVTSTCDMIRNFMDTTTNYHFLGVLFEELPLNVMSLIIDYDAWIIDPDIPRTIREGDPELQKNKKRMNGNVGQGGGSKGWKHYNKEVEPSRWTTKWDWVVAETLMSQPKQFVKVKVNKIDGAEDEEQDEQTLGKQFTEKFLSISSNTNNIWGQILQNNLVFESLPPTIVAGTTEIRHELSFSECGSLKKYAKPGHCYSTVDNEMNDSPYDKHRRRVTKPTLWSEIDGSPGNYLVACASDCVQNVDLTNYPECEGCHHILQASEIEWQQSNTNDDVYETWESIDTGACSYDVSMETGYVCSIDPTEEEEVTKCDILFNDHKERHNFPTAGTTSDEDILWQCLECETYCDNVEVLQNEFDPTPDIDDVVWSPEHCVGCGIFEQIEDPIVGITHKGPVVNKGATPGNSGKVTLYEQMITKIQQQISELDSTQFKTFIKDKFESDYGGQVYVSEDGSIYWDVISAHNTPIDKQVTDDYHLFGVENLLDDERCDVANANDKQKNVRCEFVAFKTDRTKREAGHLEGNIANGCIAGEDQKDYNKYSCDTKITNGTIDKLKKFNDEIHVNKYGLKLPLVRRETTVKTKIRNHHEMSWLNGVLPFFADHQRSNRNSKNQDYLAFIFDNRKRCEEAYNGRSLTDFACFKDNTDQIELIVPWLGHDYSFLTKDHYKRVRYVNTRNNPGSENMKRVGIGMDMCEVVGRTKVPCAATTCWDPAYTKYEQNKTVCKYSKSLNNYYEIELPYISNLQYLERMVDVNDIYNPRAYKSHCNIKYDRVEDQISKGEKCTHNQAPLGYNAAEFMGRARPAPSLDRNLVEIEKSHMTKDIFRIQKTRYSSMWGGDIIASVIRDSAQDQAVFGLLAVDPKQLSPVSITLTVGETGSFFVSNVRLLKETKSIPSSWVSNSYVNLNDDIRKISMNPIYNTSCNAETECLPEHWSCPFILASLFGGSTYARKRHPNIKLVTPDPIRMKQLYPELSGANPLVKTRDIRLGVDIQEYLQFGPALFVNKNMPNPSNVLWYTEIERTLQMFLTRKAIKTRIMRPDANDMSSSMDWPNIMGNLRSGEKMDVLQNEAEDMGHKIPNFFIAIQHSNMGNQRTEPKLTNSSSSSFNVSRKTKQKLYTNIQRSTIDIGGDCHKSPMLRISQNELNTILDSDVCYVNPENTTHSMLECSKRAKNDTIRMLISTSPPSGQNAHQKTDEYSYSVRKACSPVTEEKTKIKTKIYKSNKNNGGNRKLTNQDFKYVPNEISLSRRVRISPLWNMIDRLHSFPLHNSLSPEKIWVATDDKRLKNPRWLVSKEIANNENSSWHTNWILENTDPSCKENVGRLQKHEWYNNPNKGNMCNAVVRDHERKSDCMKTLANTFDICQIPQFQDFCTRVQAFRDQIRYVNAWANSYTNIHKNLYLPSNYLPQDGFYAWHAVLETYITIGIDVQNAQTCPHVKFFFSDARIKQDSFTTCPSAALFAISKTIERFKTIVMKAVNCLILINELFFNVMALFMALIMNVEFPKMDQYQRDEIRTRKKALTDKYAQAALNNVIELMQEFADFFIQFISFFWEMLKDTFFGVFFDLIKFICEFVRAYISAVLSYIINIIDVFGGNASELQKLKDTINEHPCDFFRQSLTNNIQPDAKYLDASNCYVQKNGFTSPTDFLGGLVGSFTCGATSRCLKSIDSTEDAILCYDCDDVKITDYSCDLATKQCVCGRRSADANTCLKNVECNQENSMCDLKASVYSPSYGTIKCHSGTGNSFCLKTSPHVGTGLCTKYKNEVIDMLASCKNPSIDLQKCNFAETLCSGTANSIQSTEPILLNDMFIFPCAEICNQQLIVACLQVVRQDVIENHRHLAITHATSAKRNRRLLSNDIGYGMLYNFLLTSVNRKQDIIGDCYNIMLVCTDIIDENNAVTNTTKQDTQTQSCLNCIRWWWFWNSTLTSIPLPNHIRDTDMLDIRNVVKKMATHVHLIPFIMINTPLALCTLFRDWLQDDFIFNQISEKMNTPINILKIYWENMQIFYDNIYSKSHTQQHRPNNNTLDVNSARIIMPSRTTTYMHTQPLTPRKMVHASNYTHKTQYYMQHDTTEQATQNRRKLLQFDTVLIDKTNEKGKRNLVAVPLLNFSYFKEIDIATSLAQESAETDLYNLKLQSIKNIFESTNSMQCSIDYGVIFNNIILSFSNVLKKDGWRLKRICNADEMASFADKQVYCPIVMVPFLRVMKNTIVVMKYYTQMFESGCLKNMSKNCIPEAKFSASGFDAAFPALPPNTGVVTNNNEEEKDAISKLIIDAVYFMTSRIFSIDNDILLSNIISFGSTDALYDDTLYAKMISHNHYSIGRLARELSQCNLEEIVYCNSKNLRLSDVFFVMFVLIGLLHFFIPIPSVPSFFLWTLGLSYGVLYMSYNFSPICAPRIPTCFGQGMYDLASNILPNRITIPKSLYNYTICTSNLTLKPDFVISHANIMCARSCTSSPFDMQDTVSVVFAMETLFRGRDATFSKYVIEQIEPFLPIRSNNNYNQTIVNYAIRYKANDDEFRDGLLICIIFNSYKIVSLILVTLLVLPIVVRSILLIIHIFSTMVVQSFFLVKNRL